MNLPPRDIELILKLYRLWKGSTYKGERENAEKKLFKLLLKHGYGRDDADAVIAELEAWEAANTPKPRAAPPQGTKGPEINVLNLTLDFFERYVSMTDDQRMAAALWALHTWLFDQFDHTPRLAVLGPFKRMGKTRILKLLQQLTHQPYYSENVTAAAIYQGLASQNETLLLDEGENLGLLNERTLRAVFNGGWERGGTISRGSSHGQRVDYPTFAPLALAARTKVPLPDTFLDRSIIIKSRRSRQTEKKPERLSPHTISEQALEFAGSREQIQLWAQTCTLTHDPAMPADLDDRAHDCWRVLLAIADDLGHGDDARQAAINLSANRQLSDDPAVVVLRDIYSVFAKIKRDRITSISLVPTLCAIDNRPWNVWRGPNDDRQPHELTERDLAELLSPFQIYPRTIRLSTNTAMGYHQHQFEQAWQEFEIPEPPSSPNTPTQPPEIKQLKQSTQRKRRQKK
jgi:Protein of unknown function (DUF3631)